MQYKTFTTAAGEKLNEIYNDFSINVTRIYNRPLLHMAIDLAFHSLLYFKFKEHMLTRGWLDVLILGDTRTGKSECASKLIKHYRMGELITGENISKAGLIGGLNVINNRWIIKWGKLPINDRNLVVLDEVSGMSEELISDLSGIRSSGIAEIVKIRSDRTYARTRLVWLSNPNSKRGINSYSFPVYAVADLIKRPEDIARFDYAMVLKSDDVPLEVVNIKKTPKTKHIYTTDICQKIVLWAWSRKAHEIKFTPEAEECVLDVATELGKKYSSEIPLIEPNEIRIKIARISAAIACRLFSTEDGINLIIKPEHVIVTKNFLEDIYRGMGYDTYSMSRKMVLSGEERQELTTLIQSKPPELVIGLLDINVITAQDVADLISCDIPDANLLISQFVRKNLLKRYKRGYVKTPAMIKILKEIQEMQPDRFQDI